MSVITLYPDRIVAGWPAEEDTVWPASIADLCPYFFDRLELDPAYTLGDLFRLIDREDLPVLEAVLGERIAPLVDEARSPARSDEPLGIDFLRVSNRHDDGSLLREFDGWGSWSEPYEGAWEREPESPRAGAISVSLSAVNRLLDRPLRYDPSLIFRSPAGVEEYRTTIDITFIEFLKAIFYDLTFYGTPDERDETRAELDRRVEEVRSGEAELIPFDEVLKRLGRPPE